MDTHLPTAQKFPHIRSRIFFVFLTLLICVPSLKVAADIGPKPTSSFHFEWEGENQPTIVEGILLQCKDAECADNYPLEEIGPQHFTCSGTACDSMAYSYTQHAKLVVTFSDGVTRESNIFEKEYDVSQYKVTVRTADLAVTESQGVNHKFVTPDAFDSFFRLLNIVLGLLALVILSVIIIAIVLRTADKPLEYTFTKIPCLSTWIIAFTASIIGLVFAPTIPFTIAIEGIVISLYALIKKHTWFPWITVITLGNLFTQVLYLTLLSVVGSWGPPFILTVFLEISIWLIEALLIHLSLRRQNSIAGSLGISLIINLVSMGIGWLLPL